MMDSWNSIANEVNNLVPGHGFGWGFKNNWFRTWILPNLWRFYNSSCVCYLLSNFSIFPWHICFWGNFYSSHSIISNYLIRLGLYSSNFMGGVRINKSYVSCLLGNMFHIYNFIPYVQMRDSPYYKLIFFMSKYGFSCIWNHWNCFCFTQS